MSYCLDYKYTNKHYPEQLLFSPYYQSLFPFYSFPYCHLPFPIYQRDLRKISSPQFRVYSFSFTDHGTNHGYLF
jgi:hypothetical protein